MSVNDLITEQDEAKAYEYTFILWPKHWEEYTKNFGHNFVWRERKFLTSEVANIPKKPGLYTFTVKPSIADHPSNSYVMYIGKTSRTLRKRFSEYLYEMRRETGRPKILRVLNKYPRNVFFCYTVLEVNDAELKEKEEALMLGWLPPANWPRLPSKVRRIVEALR